MIITFVVFLSILSILVLVHEFGHFAIGRLGKIGIVEFALGLPFTKPLWSKRLKSGMRLSLYPLLFGGFVKLLGEEGEEGRGKDGVLGEHFYRANVWIRIAVVIAGVMMNFLLAIVVFYIFLSLSNFQVLIPKLAEYRFLSPHQVKVVVTYVQDNSPAKTAHLVPGDIITAVDKKVFDNMAAFQTYTKSRAGEKVELTVEDISLTKTRQIEITPRKNPPAGQGAIGVAIGEGVLISYPTLGDRLSSGLLYSVDMLAYNLRTLTHLMFSAYRTGNAAPLAETVSGPVGIAQAVGTIVNLGGREALVALINFLGLLSLSLGFMNILPIPALDGGRLMFLLVEAVTSKKLAAKRENFINQIGMLLLLGLIMLVSYNDLIKLFRH